MGILHYWLIKELHPVYSVMKMVYLVRWPVCRHDRHWFRCCVVISGTQTTEITTVTDARHHTSRSVGGNQLITSLPCPGRPSGRQTGPRLIALLSCVDRNHNGCSLLLR